MNIWAIADLHLSFGVPDKNMDVFSPAWKDHAEKIAHNWKEVIAPEDLVLIAGDISWALHVQDAIIDLKWIDQLPGTKVMIRGNHDYWWNSLSKVKAILPPSCHVIQNDAFQWNDVSIGGARLWDSSEYGFNDYIAFTERAKPKEKKAVSEVDDEKIFERELQRLEMSLKALKQDAATRIVMTHYPPIGATLLPSRASQLFEKYRVDSVLFGHLHSVKKDKPLFGEARGVRYLLTACDYLDFKPLQLSLTNRNQKTRS